MGSPSLWGGAVHCRKGNIRLRGHLCTQPSMKDYHTRVLVLHSEYSHITLGEGSWTIDESEVSTIAAYARTDPVAAWEIMINDYGNVCGSHVTAALVEVGISQHPWGHGLKLWWQGMGKILEVSESIQLRLFSRAGRWNIASSVTGHKACLQALHGWKQDCWILPPSLWTWRPTWLSKNFGFQ